MANPDNAVWFGAYINGDLAGFSCIVIKNNNARFKSDFVLYKDRNKGVYDALFKKRLEYARIKGVKKVTAFCTPMSIGTFLRYGFTPIKKNKNGIYFVRKDL